MDIQAQVQLQRHPKTVQGLLGSSRLHPAAGVNYDLNFSPVVKPATVHTVLSLVVSCSLHFHQLDVKNMFLHGTIFETVYYSQPTRFVDPMQPDQVCRLNKSLYGLKQAPRAWYSRFTTYHSL
jgi:hypothetical protein